MNKDFALLENIKGKEANSASSKISKKNVHDIVMYKVADYC